MTAQRNIETGVDKLVDLIERKKRLTINDAANELGVSITVLQEWADFLEDEGLITVDYKLSKTYLCERKLTKKEVEKKAKRYASKKDAFTRKVETVLKSLQRESAGFDRIKGEFNKLKDTIGSDIEQVKEELQELKHYEELKKSIDKDIIQQRLDFQEMLNNVHHQIADHKKKYEKFIDDLGAEKAKIEEARVEMTYLENRAENLKKRLSALKEIIRSIENKIIDQREVIKSSVEKIKADLNAAEKLQKDLRFRINSELSPLIKISKEKEEKILAVQDSILKKIVAKKKEIDKYRLEGVEAAEKFKSFFEKKSKTQELINTLEKEKADLEKELKELIMTAHSFNLSVKSSDVHNYVKELQASFKNIEKKKSSFTKRLGELMDKISNQ